jgi:glycosyltransferase involved in cell wall biosynthesis
VADLVPVKGHVTLLQALSLVPGAHLLVAGRPLDTGYAGVLQREADELDLTGRVHFIGDVEDVPALLAESDVFVLPSLKKGEGCPITLLEAMSCGKPCIATDIPGSRDLIIDQESGLLVLPEEPFTLADAMQRLLNDPQFASALGESARDRVEKLYTIERAVEEHIRLYEGALGF